MKKGDGTDRGTQGGKGEAKTKGDRQTDWQAGRGILAGGQAGRGIWAARQAEERNETGRQVIRQAGWQAGRGRE